ncbi:threonine synthase [soil metagenome]
MRFYSTSDKDYKVSFEAAVRQGLAPGGGLFMPEAIEPLPAEFWKHISSRPFNDIAFHVGSQFLKGAIPDFELKKIINHTVSFDAPLVEIDRNIFALELFHGPTMAFKDFGARFLSGLFGYFARENENEITILVATSGDTGSAVANGFLNVKGTRVIVLYPSGKVSEVQEKQFTTIGHNITALEVDGTFDDCQWLVKQAFSDEALRKRLSLTSANSINIARLLPQLFYYFYAYSKLKDKNHPVVFSVPSGNFGNLTAGLMAKKMGLPVKKFIAATNINDIVPEYLRKKLFSPRSSIQTISNAMDVGNPSNFSRMVDLYGNDFTKLSEDVSGFSFDDAETKRIMNDVFKNNGYLLDPHGAIGYLGLKEYLKNGNDATGIFLETAHPGKFRDVVEDAIGQSIMLPESLMKFLKGEKKAVKMGSSFDEFKSYLDLIR